MDSTNFTVVRLTGSRSDASNKDVCGEGGFIPECAGDCDVSILMRGIKTPEQWVSVGDDFFGVIQDWPESLHIGGVKVSL